MPSQSYKAALLSFFALVLLTLWLAVPGSKRTDRPAREVASLDRSADYQKRRQMKIQPVLSPFARSKVVVRGDQVKTLQKPGVSGAADVSEQDGSLAAGTELIAVIDNECVRGQAASSTMRPSSSSASVLKVQAYRYVLEKETDLRELSDAAEQDPCLVGISENGLVRAGSFFADPRAGEQLHLSNIRIQQAENFFFKSSLKANPKVILAVVDTGVDYNHEDLKAQMWANSKGQHGFDFANDDNDPMDDNNHGTHVAGLAAAAGGNGTGVSGVMPAQIQIMAVKILDDEGSGSFADVANGIRYAVDNGADVVNLSLSGSGKNAAVQDALAYAVNKGVPVIVSAGNDGVELDDADNFRTPASLGRLFSGVITVGSIDASSSAKSSFSNHGKNFVEIGAPGSNGILSTLPDNAYGTMSGTSMSAPVVAGTAALVIGAFKTGGVVYTAADVEAVLTLSAVENDALKDHFKNGRQLDAPSAKTYLLHRYVAPLNGGLEDEY